MLRNHSLGLIFSDFFALFYPNYCLACSLTLSPSEKTICTKCLAELQETSLHERQPNELHQRFYELPALIYTFSFYWFKPAGTLQKLLHALKYKGMSEIGSFFGERYAHVLVKKNYHHQIDMVCSVPLHFVKYKKRGYNQADLIAESIADNFNIPFKRLLKKKVNRKSQTRKQRLERFHNVEDTFDLLSNINLRKKHVLVVDDVITTGATIQSACQPLIRAGASVSILAIAAVR